MIYVFFSVYKIYFWLGYSHYAYVHLCFDCWGGTARAESSIERGKSLVRQHCSRCHVIPGLNPYGGIGSTPSFSTMKWLDDWRRRFEIFYILPPHPALVRIDGVSDPRNKSLPAFSSEIVMSLEDLDDILNFVDTIKPPQ